MAEGVDTTIAAPPEEEEEDGLPAKDESPAVELHPVVRPKERARSRSQGAEGKDAGLVRDTPPAPASGEWWTSPALAGVSKEPASASYNERFQQWRERRWIDEEDGDWSYSTGLGQSTMEILKERFGEASFRDAPSWQPWLVGSESGTSWARPPATTETRFRLASPKLRVGPPPNNPRPPGPQGAGPRGAGVPGSVPSGPGPAGPAGVWGPQPVWGPPPLQAAFDGNPDRVALFLSQVLSYIDLYGRLYPSPWSMVVAITTTLTGEAADWVADLHNDHARELTDVGLFLEGLRVRFEDDTRVQVAESELVAVKQRGRPAKEYVKEFRRLAGRVRGWPERMLVHQFHLGLDRDLRQACVYRGMPPRLSEWCKAAIDMDVGLREFRARLPGPIPVRRQPDKPAFGRPIGRGESGTRVNDSAQRPLRCFRCNQVGHRALECPLPPAQPAGRDTPMASGKPRGRATPEKTRGLTQTGQSPNGSSAKDTGTPNQTGPFPMVITESEEEEEDLNDPMVSDPIHPFLIPITLASGKGPNIQHDALVDSGCTRCLMRRSLATRLGIRLRSLKTPITFEQMDGSVLGGAPATHVTGLVRMEIGPHWEYIRFIIVDAAIEPVILGLSWLDKWRPTIWWEGGFRKIRLARGPEPEQGRETGQGVATGLDRCPAGVPAVYADLAPVFDEDECDTLPPHRPTDCAIELIPGVKLPKPRMYAMTPREIEELRKYIDKNLARGFIQPSRSHMAAPVLFREKKDGGLRLCVDYRGLNAVSVEPLYPLPLMKDLLAALATGTYFTKLDLREAYYRVRVKQGDEWKTTFNCPLGSYKFCVMPFGLQGAPAVFMQLINEVLHDFLYRGVLVYLDDILIYSTDLDEHIRLVRQVLKRLLAARLYVKVSKCEFHRTELDYLGYRISKDGLAMDPAKVNAVLDWQAPMTRRQLQSFLGFANFYRHFIPAFAQIALPLTNLLRTKGEGPVRPGRRLDWTMECQAAFETLKQCFAKAPVLQHPDQTKPFLVQVDASDVAVGAVLLQADAQGQLHPCAYTSKKFTPTERGWAVWEKEAFAVRWALLTWRHLLEGAQVPFEVWTDHRNLIALQTPRKLSPKQVRWAHYFQRFQFTLKHVPGGKNFLADALSRMPQFNSKRDEVVQAMVPESDPTLIAVTGEKHMEWKDTVLRGLATDEWFQEHKHLFTHGDGLPWKGDKLYVPKEVRALVLQQCHDNKQAGHFGFLKTLHLTRRQFWWPHMRRDIEAYTRECAVCAKTKPRPGKPLGLLQSVATPTRPWEEIGMDFIVELPDSDGNTVIWTIIDLFSKQAHFIPCRGLPSARKLAKLFIQHVYRLHGVPRRIISDRGVQFTARFWRNFLSAIGSAQGLSSAFHPSTNGAAERANAMIERYLRCYVSYQQSDWSTLLPFAEVAYNNTVHSSTGLTPFKIAMGREFVAIPELNQTPTETCMPQEWADKLTAVWPQVREALDKATQVYKDQADKHRTAAQPLQVGDMVYLSTKYIKLRLPSRKLGPKYIGPFPVVKVINPVTVRLKLPPVLGKVHPVFHYSLLKPVKHTPIRFDRPGPLSNGQYEVDEILDSRIKGGKLCYLVKWKGYPLEEASWVPYTNVEARRLVRRFHRRYPTKPQAPANVCVLFPTERAVVKGEPPVEPSIPLDTANALATTGDGYLLGDGGTNTGGRVRGGGGGIGCGAMRSTFLTQDEANVPESSGHMKKSQRFKRGVVLKYGRGELVINGRAI